MREDHPHQLENKLSPKWTGPVRMSEALGNGAYRLETLEGGAIPRTCLSFISVKIIALYTDLGDTLFPS